MRPLSNINALAVFAMFATLLFLETRLVIPWLKGVTALEPILLWFSVAGVGTFLPMLVLAWFSLKSEDNYHSWPAIWQRLRFRTMDRGDWIWTIGALLVIGSLSFLAMESMKYFFTDFLPNPPFLQMDPLVEGRYWILAAWLLFWPFNILGEEILWRGVLLPRQELATGRYSWLMHGVGWCIFHITFGWQLLITLTPILFILPYVTQKRKNTWVGVIIHGGLNGPGFIAVAFGLV